MENKKLIPYIEEAYRLFAPYNISLPLTVCDCGNCITEKEQKLLITTPLRELSQDLIETYISAMFDNEDKAKEVLEKAKAEGADFAQLAKDNSTDEKTKANGGEITFDSASTEVPEQVKKAAFALDVNGVSDVISVTGTQAYSSQYYIVKLIKKTEKSSNIDDYKEKLKTVILTQKQNDASFVQSIIGKELQAANIKVKDQAFQNIFTQYIGGGDSSSSSSSKE